MPPLKKIIITAGPTREMLDPVRFLSNVSTGEMGYAVARTAKRLGYQVTLISGPTHLKPPKGVKFVPIVSANDMKRACEKMFPQNDALIMSAAVCDFTAAKLSRQKIHRTTTKEIHLMQTPDILAGLGRKKGKRVVIGFCLETEHWLANAKRKLDSKNLDGIVANYYTARHIPFGNRRINTAFLDSIDNLKLLKNKAKSEIALALIRWLESLWKIKFSNKGK